MPADPKTPAQMADEIRLPILDNAPESVTPRALKVLIDELWAFTDRVNQLETNAHVAGDIEGPAHAVLRADIQRWSDLLTYYTEQVDAAPPDDATATAHSVYGPLLVGICYGAPSCSQELADAWAPGGFPIAPTIGIPFAILDEVGVAQLAEEQNTVAKAIGEAMGDYLKGAADVVRDVVSGAVSSLDFPKLDIPRWAWPLAGLGAAALIYAIARR